MIFKKSFEIIFFTNSWNLYLIIKLIKSQHLYPKIFNSSSVGIKIAEAFSFKKLVWYPFAGQGKLLPCFWKRVVRSLLLDDFF